MTGEKRTNHGKPPLKVKPRSAPANVQSTTSQSPVSEHHRIALLNDGQRDCLRLVSENRTSKDIARLLDVSPHTVDMRLRLAMRTLNVSTRGDAARMFGEYAILHSGHEKPAEAAPTSASAALGEPRLAPSVPSEQGRNLVLPVTRSLPWGRINTLTGRQRIAWIAAIMATSGLTFTGIVVVLRTLKQAFS